MKTRLIKIKRVYRYIPTCLTLGNTLCGFTAILITLQVYEGSKDEVSKLLALSAWLIGGAMIFDMLDGWTARKLNASSPYGMEMDSLADMVTFGVAPGIMVAVMARAGNSFHWLPWPWVVVACYVYVSCAALRLALYNVLAMEKTSSGSTRFHGLPSPGGAAAICSLVVLFRADLDSTLVYRLVQILPFYAVILGGLMVSSLPYVHIGKLLGSKRRNKLKILALFALGLPLVFRPHLFAAIYVNVYILSGPIIALFSWGRNGRQRTSAGEAA